MKRLISLIALLTIMVFAVCVYADGNRIITNTLFEGQWFAASSGVTSEIIPIDHWKLDGYHNMVVTVAGDGTLQVYYQLSNDNLTWRTPSTASDIVTAHLKTSGKDGVEMYSFSPMVAPYIRFCFTETGTSSGVTVTAIYGAQ